MLLTRGDGTGDIAAVQSLDTGEDDDHFNPSMQ